VPLRYCDCCLLLAGRALAEGPWLEGLSDGEVGAPACVVGNAVDGLAADLWVVDRFVEQVVGKSFNAEAFEARFIQPEAQISADQGIGLRPWIERFCRIP